jgi:prepilin-type N-terminal cleavage/methylation domain-containing protein
MNHNFLKNSKGFTLVEMLVVSTVFIIIIVAVINIFVSALKSERYILASQHLIDQGNYAMEYMSRSLRMAKKSTGSECELNPSAPTYYWYWDQDQSVLYFKKYDGSCKFFVLDPVGKQLYECDYSSGDCNLLISSKIDVVDFKASVNDATSIQPKVTIYLELKSKGAEPQPSIKLQTTISQRDLNTP